MQPTSVNQKHHAWRKATATAREQKNSQGLVRFEAWIPKDLKKRLELEAASQQIGRDKQLRRILKTHFGERQEVSPQKQEEEKVPTSEQASKRSAVPTKEKEWLKCDDIDKLRELAGRARVKYDRQYRRATKLNPQLWPKRLIRGKDVSDRGPKTKVVMNLSATAKAKIADAAVIKLRQTIEAWETKRQILIDEIAKINQ